MVSNLEMQSDFMAAGAEVPVTRTDRRADEQSDETKPLQNSSKLTHFQIDPRLCKLQKLPLESTPKFSAEYSEFAALLPSLLLTLQWTQNFQNVQFNPYILPQTSKCAFQPL
ncbi:hypothetical protein F2Q69_00042557 [Brassica cretica]|uniref:Uncharacterized protein n=1 Tax=Brassica cretica TaxID=69181 RepID=A0A8S9NJV4_BRACR|nr:hypothetical protein F2Q69_00042557 [Brassica cretica]